MNLSHLRAVHLRLYVQDFPFGSSRQGGIESGLAMELALNLVWLFAAAALVCFWKVQQHRRTGRRLLELVSIAALIFILFPIISVTDDLQIAQSFVETDTTVRRGHDGVQPFSIFPAASALPEASFQLAAQNPGFAQAVSALPAPVLLTMVLAERYNRPPPAA
jgi:hypothetical protein